MRALLCVIAACGGGPSGSLDLTVDIGGTPTELTETCELTEGDEYFDLHGGSDTLAVEIKWRKNAISTPGTYTSTGIVSDVTFFVLHPVEGEPTISSATGSVTFTQYAPPDVVTGTFDVEVPDAAVSATGVFECR